MQPRSKAPIAIIVTIIVLVIVTLAWFTLNAQLNKQEVAITLPANTSANIFKAADVNNEHGDIPAAVATLSGGNATIKLDKGEYTAITAENNEYQSTRKDFSVSNDKLELFIEPAQSESKQRAALAAEQVTINAALIRAFPNIQTLYTISNGKLYEQGQWFTATLVYKGPSAAHPSDTLRVVMTKKDNQWQPATTPQIVLSIPQHPEIPASIIRDVNSTK